MSFWRSMYSASSWASALESMHADALRRNGVSASGGPWLTNLEVVAIVDELKRTARVLGTTFPHWEQWEAIAYGYDGTDFHPDEMQQSMIFPDEYTGDLWAWMIDLASELDRRDTSDGARVLNPDATSWAKESMTARQAIADNGGECRVPLPGVPPEQWPKCKDVVDAIKKKLPPPDEAMPVLKPIRALKRLLPLIALGVAAAYLLNDGDK